MNMFVNFYVDKQSYTVSVLDVRNSIWSIESLTIAVPLVRSRSGKKTTREYYLIIYLFI